MKHVAYIKFDDDGIPQGGSFGFYSPINNGGGVFTLPLVHPGTLPTQDMAVIVSPSTPVPLTAGWEIITNAEGMATSVVVTTNSGDTIAVFLTSVDISDYIQPD